MEKRIEFIDSKGKSHMINRKQFIHLMEILARRAKARHNIKVIEESQVEE